MNNHRYWPHVESPGFRDPESWRSPVAIRLSRNAPELADSIWQLSPTIHIWS